MKTIMGKKERKFALKKILNNRVMVYMISTAMGCDKGMKFDERQYLVKDMIKTYHEENYTDSFTVNFIGVGEKKNRKSGLFGGGYRNSDLDEYYGGAPELTDEEYENLDFLNRVAKK